MNVKVEIGASTYNSRLDSPVTSCKLKSFTETSGDGAEEAH